MEIPGNTAHGGNHMLYDSRFFSTAAGFSDEGKTGRIKVHFPIRSLS